MPQFLLSVSGRFCFMWSKYLDLSVFLEPCNRHCSSVPYLLPSVLFVVPLFCNFSSIVFDPWLLLCFPVHFLVRSCYSSVSACALCFLCFSVHLVDSRLDTLFASPPAGALLKIGHACLNLAPQPCLSIQPVWMLLSVSCEQQAPSRVWQFLLVWKMISIHDSL